MTRAWPLARLALIALAAVVGASWIVLAAAHADDRYLVDFVSGTWLALADYAAGGTLYPAVYDDGYLGGTRYMPLPTVLDAGAAKLVGGLLLSAKLVTYLVALALVAVALTVLHEVGCPWPLASALVAAVLVTRTGMVGTLGLRNDGLAVALQLGAVALVLRRGDTVSTAAAGVVAALAIFAKVSAVWAAAAIAIWLLWGARARLRAFGAAFAVTLAVLAGVFEVLSSGRFLSQLARFTFAGTGSVASLVDGAQALLTQLATQADAVWLLVPLAVVAMLLSLRARTLTLLQIALLVEVVVLTVVMSSRGTDHNHLLDLCFLTVLVVGELAGRSAAEPERAFVVLVVAVAVAWGVVSSYQRVMGPEANGALRELAGRGGGTANLDPNPLEGFVRPPDRLLSEDPTIPLALDQRPVLLDSFIARITLADHEPWAEAVARRVSAKEFDKIILVAGLAPGTPLYPRQFLGRTVNDAVLASYRLVHVERDIYVYLPAD